jgi:hypothetical protein
MITAKVRCNTKTESGDGDARQANVTFYPDYADGRNAEWAAATPSLNLTMTLNGRAADLFEQGAAYTLQFVENDA